VSDKSLKALYDNVMKGLHSDPAGMPLLVGLIINAAESMPVEILVEALNAHPGIEMSAMIHFRKVLERVTNTSIQ
jgi:hypothetical protein